MPTWMAELVRPTRAHTATRSSDADKAGLSPVGRTGLWVSAKSAQASAATAVQQVMHFDASDPTTPPLDPLTLSDLEALAALVIADAAPCPVERARPELTVSIANALGAGAPNARDPVELEVDALFAELWLSTRSASELAAYFAERAADPGPLPPPACSASELAACSAGPSRFAEPCDDDCPAQCWGFTCCLARAAQ